MHWFLSSSISLANSCRCLGVTAAWANVRTGVSSVRPKRRPYSRTVHTCIHKRVQVQRSHFLRVLCVLCVCCVCVCVRVCVVRRYSANDTDTRECTCSGVQLCRFLALGDAPASSRSLHTSADWLCAAQCKLNVKW
jgi:hypothetical protein